jgi:LysR family nitrogen assimilation transcriptional regulator
LDGARAYHPAEMEFRQIRYFRVVSEMGSFTQAAHALGLGQPSLSKQIRQLEAELDVALLVRDGRGVRLTAAGAELYDRVADIDDRLSAAVAAVAQLGSHARTISIGAASLLGPAFLADVVAAVGARYPQSEIRLVEGYSQQVAAWLQSGRLDIALLYGGHDSPQVEDLLGVVQDLYLVSSPGAVSAPVELAEMSRERLIAFDRPSQLRARFERAAQDAGVILHFVHAIDSVPVIKEMVMRGVGVIGLPFSTVADEVVAGHLQARQIVGPHMQLELRVLTSRRSGLGREIYTVFDILRDLLEDRCRSGRWRGSRLAKR